MNTERIVKQAPDDCVEFWEWEERMFLPSRQLHRRKMSRECMGRCQVPDLPCPGDLAFRHSGKTSQKRTPVSITVHHLCLKRHFKRT